MKSPNAGNKLPDFSGQSKILFCNEGNPTAMLLTNKSGRRNQKPMNFPQAEAALAWCRSHGAVLIYLPSDLARN